MVSRRYQVDQYPTLERFGLNFSNPLGMAAGFDKNGIVVNQLASLGFGFVEVGTVTLRPQKGNEKPRLFRLPEDHALINRLGFNNEGAVEVAGRLRHVKRRCILGINIGRNKDVANEDAVENYLATFDLVRPVADYIAVNISSPNTPGLRELQRGENLEELIGALMERVRSPAFRRPVVSGEVAQGSELPPKGGTPYAPPLLVKIAPDLSDGEIESIVDICTRLGVSGIIATNTTVSRDSLRTPGATDLGPGGLSGRPLASRSTDVIRTVYRHSSGKLPIIGVGGIFTAEDAFEKITAGASLVQAYTGFVYHGPGFARDINRELSKILKERGFASVDEAVGASV
jgi:dihydroorotate dehydrogenase